MYGVSVHVMTATCQCGRPCAESGFICGTCSDDYAAALAAVPGVAHELIITLSKQQRFVESAAVLHRANGLPYDIAASDALHRLRAELVALVRLCLEEKVRSTDYREREPSDTLPSMSSWLLWRVDGVASMPWAADALRFVDVIEHCEEVIDRPAERLYAGPCDDCGHDLYVEHGSALVTCERCGKAYDVKQRRDWLLSVLDDRLATAPELARALSSWELPITHELVRQWRHRGRLKPRAKDARGVPLYRVGDVIELLTQRAREQQRRAQRHA